MGFSGTLPAGGRASVAGIAVVGGGIAGLACAWRLARSGHDVELFERGDAPGGRMRSLRRDGFLLDAGAPCFARSDAAVRAVSDAVGLAPDRSPYLHAQDAWMRGGALHLLGRDGASGVGLVEGALRLARARRQPLDRRVDPERPQRISGPRLQVELTRDADAAALSWLPARDDADLPQLRALAALRARWSGAEIQSFPGGAGELARVLAERVRVRTGCTVRRVESFTDGARLRVEEAGVGRTREADAVVVAVPGTRVLSLCPKLTPEERGFFEAIRYASALVVFLAFERVPRALVRSVWIAPEARLELSSLLLEHLRPGATPAGAGLVRALLAPAAALRMHRAPDASIADLALENLIYGRFGTPPPAGYHVFRFTDAWPRRDFEDLRRLARFLQRFERSPRLVFAGDYLLAPSADGALASGLRAAAELERGL
jgi:protoporphyrinogen/coproporphyrinogen III oxidase